MKSRVEKFKDKRIIRFLIVYGVSTLSIMHFAELVFPKLHLPEWSVTLVVVLVLIGFPLTVALAWVTAPIEKKKVIKKVGQKTQTGNVKHTIVEHIEHRRKLSWPRIIISSLAGVALVVAGYLLFSYLFSSEVKAAKESDHSIAVLPFENQSPSSNDAYVASGLSDEILTQLCKIGELRVISRTSVMGYKNSGKSIKQIADELGVKYILEGATALNDGKIHVNVQLINAESDKHVWVENYDHIIDDIFEIQAEIAKKIAASLNTKISSLELKQLSDKPTEDINAYIYFIKGKLIADLATSTDEFLNAIKVVDSALVIDDKFSRAYILKAFCLISAYTYQAYPDESLLNDANNALKRAELIDPSGAELLLTKGTYFQTKGECDLAATLFREYIKDHPSNASAHQHLATVSFYKGDYVAAKQHALIAYKLEPFDLLTTQWVAYSYVPFFRFDSTIYYYNKLPPGRNQFVNLSAYNFVIGNYELAASFEDSVMKVSPTETENNKLIKLYILNFTTPDLHIYIDSIFKFYSPVDLAVSEDDNMITTQNYNIGLAYFAMGDKKNSSLYLQKAKEYLRSREKSEANSFRINTSLALAEAFLGNKSVSLSYLDRAKALTNTICNQDRYGFFLYTSLYVYIGLGMYKEAIDLLNAVRSKPQPVYITTNTLKNDPIIKMLSKESNFNSLWRGNYLKPSF